MTLLFSEPEAPLSTVAHAAAASAPSLPVLPWQRTSSAQVARVLPWQRAQVFAEDGLGTTPDPPAGGASDLQSMLSDYNLWGAYSAYQNDMSAGDFASSVGVGTAGLFCSLASAVEPYSAGFASFLRQICDAIASIGTGAGTGSGGTDGEYTVTNLLSDYPDLTFLNDLYSQGLSPQEAASKLSAAGIAGIVCKAISTILAIGFTAATKGKGASKAYSFFEWSTAVCGVVQETGEAIESSGGSQGSCQEGYIFDPDKGECVWQGASDLGDYDIGNFLSDFPSLGAAYEAYASGQSPDVAYNGLVAAGVFTPVCVAVSTVLAVGIGVLGRGIPTSALKGFLAFLTAVCAAVGGTVAASPEQPSANPCDNPAASCPGGMVWDPWFCRCIAQNFTLPCAKGLGYVDTEGNCIPCPLGQHYDSTQELCVDGCPEGWLPNGRYGCVDPNYNKACDWNGQKGVVTPDGECTPDGCPAGYKWDFDTESCVPSAGTTAVGGVPIKNNVPPKGGTTTKPIEIKPESPPASKGMGWGFWLGAALVVGAGILVFRSRPGAMASSGEAASGEGGETFSSNPAEPLVAGRLYWVDTVGGRMPMRLFQIRGDELGWLPVQRDTRAMTYWTDRAAAHGPVTSVDVPELKRLIKGSSSSHASSEARLALSEVQSNPIPKIRLEELERGQLYMVTTGNGPDVLRLVQIVQRSKKDRFDGGTALGWVTPLSDNTTGSYWTHLADARYKLTREHIPSLRERAQNLRWKNMPAQAESIDAAIREIEQAG